MFNGVWDATGRVLRNSTVEMRESAGRPESSLRSGEGLLNWAGHGVGLVNRIQPPVDIIKEIAEKAVQVMRKANDLIRE